ncbi:uracil-DNA glycosylase family protein [Microcoleus sp. FACHB-672]|uniref:uracil-DNA glycosylase family protein n=1 Tax=Microcoleus sp. FACHB-672 TaxID=2692825 RepID=UPI0016857EA9|nr:uracil-DNA glycosylase family protein [Microcoleus sp. FACHB-672]MBD2043504.1 uracil-DNA glycosylase [Microcoleus sp. FACHB-672]
MSDIQELIAKIQQEAQRETFPIDEPVYQAAGIEPTLPILYAGNLNSNLCFFARDLGKDEVHAKQPLRGAAGTHVRKGLYRAIYHQEPDKTTDLNSVLDKVLFTNTVPYKPPGNKAYSEAIKKRFRPFLEQFLVFHWQGNRIITLGNEALKWFLPYGERGAMKDFFEQSDRYTGSIQITLKSGDSQRQVTLQPLPHPSPLNQKYYAKFPQMLQQRLAEVFPNGD